MKTTQKFSRKALTAGVLSLSLLLVAGCGKSSGGAAKGGGDTAAAEQVPANPPTPVTVTAATEQLVTRTVPVNGSITALQSISLSPKVSARVLTVAGREGDVVSAGQAIVQQDTSDLQQQLEQAQANLQAAQAKLTQAQTNYRIQQTTSATTVQNAQSQLSAAQANLSLARQPQRSEEVRQQELAVEQAQANYDRAVADRKRYEYLVKEGASAQATLDQYATTEAVQKATLASAQQGLKIAQTGGRQESIRASQDQVRQAEIAVRQAKANTQQNAARLDDIRAAQATVAQNQAAVDLARQQVADATIRSPINGVISARTTEPGQQAAPGAAVATVVALGTVYFQAQVPETSISDVTSGRSVVVRVDALSGKTFAGKIADVFPTANATSRAFNVRVNVPNTGRLLRPGMFARGEVVAQKRRGVVVPKDALVADGDQFAVFVAAAGKAVRHPVKLGIQNSETAEVLSGVQVGDQIIVQGQTLVKDGGPIQVKENGVAVANAATATP